MWWMEYKKKKDNGFHIGTSEKVVHETYIDPTKEVKGVCVGEGGFLSSLPVLRDKRHGVHGQLG